MTSREDVNEPAAVGRRRPRRRRVVFGGALAGALWLLGVGLGWFGRAEDRAGNDAGAQSPPAAAASVGAPTPAKPPSGARQDEEKANGTGAGPAAATPAPASAEIERDRLESLLSLLQAHLRGGRIGLAEALVDRLRVQVAAGGVAAERLEAWSLRVRQGREQAEGEILACVERGEVLAADRLAAQLERDASWLPGPVLRERAALGADWSCAPRMRGLPAPPALPRGRAVRFDREGVLQVGKVVRSADGRVTVRCADTDRQRFPTVDAVALEPVNASPREAAACALRAAHAGRGRLARLWLLSARLRGAGDDPSARALQAALDGR